VVQARAEVLYLIRAARNDEAAALYERVQNVARGAALMTDCQVDIVFDKACSNLLQNATLNQVMYAKLQAEGALTVSTAEQTRAVDFQATLTASDIDAVSRPLASVLRGKVPAVFEGVAPYDASVNDVLYGSTDVADVSWITPRRRPGWPASPWHAHALVATGVAGPVRPGACRHGARGARARGHRHRAGDPARTDCPGQGGTAGAPAGQALPVPDTGGRAAAVPARLMLAVVPALPARRPRRHLA
jgi:aminobenzoyl-glutamate utilization protein B